MLWRFIHAVIPSNGWGLTGRTMGIAWARHTSLALLALALAAIASPSAAGQTNATPAMTRPPSRATITNLAGLLQLTVAEAELGHPVRMPVVSTYSHSAWRMLYVADGPNAAYFAGPEIMPELKPGDEIELEGTSIVANQAPSLRVERITAMGRRQSLTPQPLTVAEILHGDASCRWVELEGQIRKAQFLNGRLNLDISVNQTNLEMVLLHGQARDLTRLPNTTVKARGVIANTYLPTGQFVSASLLVQEPEQIVVLRPAEGADASALMSLRAALELPLDEARRGYPVKAQAVVTYSHPQWRSLFVTADNLGTYIKIPDDTPALHPGDVVEIVGSTSAANGYPEINLERLTPTGRRQPLLPQPWGLQDLLNGRASGQWVEVEAQVVAPYVRDGRLALETVVGSTNLPAYLLNWQPEQVRQLLDARVRIRGVLSVQYDARGERTGVAVLAQEPEQIQVLQLVAANPLDLPVTSINRLTPPRTAQTAPRTHLQGVFEQLLPGDLAMVRDGASVVRVRCRVRPNLPLDSRVDVLGYPALVNGELVLNDAVLLPTTLPNTPGSETLPEPGTAPVPLRELTTTRAIRQLARQEAARGYPARLEGVVTYSDISWWAVFVQDESGGVFVAPAIGGQSVRFGERVSVEGVTAAGEFAPIVSKARFTVLGESVLPAPARVTLDELLSGRFDSQWVEVQGVVRSAAEQDQRSWLQIMTDRGRFRAILGPTITHAQAEQFVDARVTVRGAAGGEFNRNGQIVSVRLHIPSLSSIQVDEAPPAEPFAVKTQRIADLLRYQPDEGVRRRAKVVGRVTSIAADDAISLQDESGGMIVRPARRATLPRLGDEVEVLGFPTLGDYSATLLYAWLRIVGPGPELSAAPTTPEKILGGEHDSELVQIEARLLEDASIRPGQRLVLQSGPVVFDAILPAQLDPERSRQLEAGSRLSLVGVCLVQAGQWGQIKSFRLQLRRPGDLKILDRPPWWNLRRLAWGLSAVAMVGLVALAWGILLANKNRSLSEQIRERRRAEAQLQQAHAALTEANERLEHRVLERTAELSETNASLSAEVQERRRAEEELRCAQSELLDASRRAGRAEVASAVLHNVGNVLNSINVSTTLVASRLRQMPFKSDLGKVVRLMQEHPDDLASFITQDERGRHLPGYLSLLSEHLAQEQRDLLGEVKHLADNVEHIKEIVARQQADSRMVGMIESVSMRELVESAASIQVGAWARCGIALVRDYHEVPSLMTDRHRVLQILVNLLQNAGHACEEGGQPEKQVVVRICAEGPETVTVEVRDNGIGIAPENLTRIFSHGFTTRRGGHGFGLHSAALAATEMGGRLIVESEGLNRGATFTLALPVRYPSELPG